MNFKKFKFIVFSLAASGLLLVGMFLLLKGAPQTAYATTGTRYVAMNGSDTSNTCTDSSTPCATIQHAVDQASTGEEIRVASGTYTDLHVTGGMTAVVQIDKPLIIQGGYTPTNWSTPSPSMYPTTIDPQGQGRGVIIAPGITVTLQGLRVTNGVGAPWGGGILAKTGAQVTIRECWIHNNQAERYSGGIHIYSGTLTVTNSFIYSNTAGYDGGGINFSHSGGVLRDNLIYNNTASQYSAGGVYLNYATDVMLENNYIFNNTAGYYGGGVYLWTSSGAVLTNNRIYGNDVTQYHGGGVYLWRSDDVALSGNDIRGNAALHSGSGIYLGYSHNITMTNNLLAENRLTDASGSAAGIYLISSSARLLHNTIARNTGGSGQGIYAVGNSTLWMTNTILVSHTVGISVTAGSTATLEATLWGSGPWANGTDWGGTGVIATGTVNLWGDPAFVNPDGGDYHIGASSAAVNAGVDAGVTTDIDGDTRPWGSGYDIGADEFLMRIYLPLVVRNYQP